MKYVGWTDRSELDFMIIFVYFPGRNYTVEDGDIIFFKFNAGAGLKDPKKKWRDKVTLLLVHLLYLNMILFYMHAVP